MKEKIIEYLNWKATYALRASTCYKKWLEYFIELCGDKPVETYSISDIIRYHQWLENRFSSYCTQFAMVVIKNFFTYCKYNNIHCLSPELIRLPRVRPKSHRAVTEEEYKKIIASIPENDFLRLRDLVIIRLLWDTGMRVSELSDLSTSDIHPNKNSTVINTKKTGKPRMVVWSDETHHLLLKYFSIREELEKNSNSSSLFIGKTPGGKGWKGSLSVKAIQRYVKEYAAKAGIKAKVTPHSFRHGWAHKRRDQNAPLAFIQRGLGHNHPVSTFVYEQYDDKEFLQNARGYLQPA